MIDVNTPVKAGIIQALSGLTFNSEPVKVYDDFNPNEESIYVLISEQTDSDNSNKSKFVTDGTVLLDIVHHSTTETGFDTVDRIAKDILQTLQPTPATNGVTLADAGLQLVRFRKSSSNTLSFKLSEESIMRRLIRYEYTVRQL